jgi:RNA polymerase primary sigma factor
MIEQRRIFGRSENEPDQNEAIDRSALKEKIDQALAILDDRESEVVKLRYGLSDGFTYTPDEIGERFGITAECVAEIEKRSVTKLRSLAVTSDL